MRFLQLLLLLLAGFPVWAKEPDRQEVPFLEPAPKERELGRRPADGAVLTGNPPVFVWKEQPRAVSYELVLARDAGFQQGVMRCGPLPLNAWLAPRPMAPGTWYWRVRAERDDGRTGAWSRTRRFDIAPDATVFCMPVFETIVKRIPAGHPRLFIRPDQLAEIRRRSAENGEYEKMIRLCDKYLAARTDISEPNAYVGKRGLPEWTKSWRRAYGHATQVSMRMAELAFGWRMTGREDYLAEAKRLLNGILNWRVDGPSSMKYNDEAGMPILRYVSRGYTFLYDALTPEERARCQQVMRARGAEAYRILCPRRLYEPFESHANRMFYFLGEAGIAFAGDIPEAADWLYFSLLYYYCHYPLWGDADGSWHEGPHYWRGYMESFTEWGDVMQNILRINPCEKPYFRNIGDFLLYSALPGSTGYGWGDFAESFSSTRALPALPVFASHGRNPYWQWYCDLAATVPGQKPAVLPSYVSMLRAQYPKVAGKAPTDLPASRFFRGNGIAVMNTSLLHASEAVQVQVKCGSQFGNFSHGFESANSFLLHAYGDRLLIRSGIRDCYGSRFHRDFMWDTQSQNNILVDGKGQKKRVFGRTGRVLAWSTTPQLDVFAGDAADCYEAGTVKKYTREIRFRKPSAILIIDRLETARPARLEWLLHAPVPFDIRDQHRVTVKNRNASCTIDLMWPEGLAVTQTTRTDPPVIDPELLAKSKEHHFRAAPAERLDKVCFVTLIRPYRNGGDVPGRGRVVRTEKGLEISVPVEDGIWRVEVDL